MPATGIVLPPDSERRWRPATPASSAGATPSTQCAAVSTRRGAITVPPQVKPRAASGEYGETSAPSHGQRPGAAGAPPTIADVAAGATSQAPRAARRSRLDPVLARNTLPARKATTRGT